MWRRNGTARYRSASSGSAQSGATGRATGTCWGRSSPSSPAGAGPSNPAPMGNRPPPIGAVPDLLPMAPGGKGGLRAGELVADLRGTALLLARGHGNADLRSARWRVGTGTPTSGRHSPPKAGGGTDPQFGGGPFAAGIPAFGVIRTLEWETLFPALRAPCLRPVNADGNEPPAALRAAVPTRGRRSLACIP